MDRVKSRRRKAENAIDANPFWIRLERWDVSEGLGRAGGIDRDSKKTLSSQKVRIFFIQTQSFGVDSQSEGGTISPKTFGLLARWDADVAKGDEFVLSDSRYRVDGVTDVTVKGDVVSKQCQIVEL